MDATTARLLNTVLIAGCALGFGIALWRAGRPESGYHAAFRWAERAELPLTESVLRHGVAARFRTAAIAEASMGLAATALSAPFLATSLAESALFLFVVMFPAILLSLPLAAVGVTLRERLFAPAPNAVRVARARQMTTADYLGPVRRATPWVLAAGSVAMLVVLVTVWVRTPDRIAAGWAVGALVVGAIALLCCLVLPPLERALLDQPQPASAPLELSWDDSLRAGALGTLRLTAAMACLVTIATAAGALTADAGLGVPFLSTQIVVWGQGTLAIMYPNRGFRLQPGVRPLAPVPGGSAA